MFVVSFIVCLLIGIEMAPAPIYLQKQFLASLHDEETVFKAFEL